MIETRFEQNYASLEVEYECSSSPVSIFTAASVGESEYKDISIGLRYYFGKKKSLKERHRHDDPRSVVRGIQTGVGNYGAEYNQQLKDYLADNYNGGSYGSSSTAVGSSYGFSFEPDIVIVGPEDQ